MSGEKPNDIGNYRILEPLGGGGSGLVYRARQENLDRDVALKVMHGGAFADADEALRFRLSAEAAASLDHPGIVPIYEIGEHRESLFVVMKLIEGGTVDLNPPRGTKEITRFMKELCGALEHAHTRGVLHGDLKPSNLLLTKSGQPMLSDFMVPGEEQEGMGTPAYMAPERLEGGEMTVATDIYGLGALLYEFLARRPVVEGKSALEVSRKVLNGEIKQPGGDRELEILCLACLAREPGERPGSVADLRDEFARILRGERIRTRKVSSFAKVKKWCRQNPLESGFLALFVGALGVTLPTVQVFPTLESPDRFGSTLSANDRHLVVAAKGSGKIEVFELGEEIRHAGMREYEEERRMGRSLLVDDGQVFVGGFSTTGRWQGVVDILSLRSLDARISRLRSKHLDSEYGESLARTPKGLLCGTPEFNDGDGAVVLFVRGNHKLMSIKNPYPNEQRLFGHAVSCEGEDLAVSAPGWGEKEGKVIVFRIGKRGMLKKRAEFSRPGQFGWSMAMTDGQLVVGAPGADSNRGAAYLIDLESYEVVHKLSAKNGLSGDRYGESVALGGSVALIGAPQAQLESRGLKVSGDYGAGYVIGIDVKSGKELYRLESPSAARGDSFGANLAISGARVFVSAERYFYPDGLDENPASDWGRVEVFDIESGEFQSRLRSHLASEINTKALVIYGTIVAIGLLFLISRKFFRRKM